MTICLWMDLNALSTKGHLKSNFFHNFHMSLMIFKGQFFIISPDIKSSPPSSHPRVKKTVLHFPPIFSWWVKIRKKKTTKNLKLILSPKQFSHLIQSVQLGNCIWKQEIQTWKQHNCIAFWLISEGVPSASENPCD